MTIDGCPELRFGDSLDFADAIDHHYADDILQKIME
jgi:hypothetical protein